VFHPEDRRLAPGGGELRVARRLDLRPEKPRDEAAQRPRDVDQQRRLLRRRQRRAVAVRLEPRRQRCLVRRQLGAEQPVQLGEPRRLEEIAVAKTLDPEWEITRFVARRSTGAARKRKSVRGQRASS
jgi:hypothetical protein